jgi:hypothetical protein
MNKKRRKPYEQGVCLNNSEDGQRVETPAKDGEKNARHTYM